MTPIPVYAFTGFLDSGKTKFIQGLKIYVGARNLWTLTKYNGFDPDVSSEGTSSTLRRMDLGAYPKPRTVIFSLQLRY